MHDVLLLSGAEVTEDLTEVERLELLVAGLRAANATLREERTAAERRAFGLAKALADAEADRDSLIQHVLKQLPPIDLTGFGGKK